MDFFEKLETVEILVVIIAVGVIGYYIYKLISGTTDVISSAATKASADISGYFDDVTGASSAPGGVGGNTYTNASKQVLQHPIDSIKTILGF